MLTFTAHADESEPFARAAVRALLDVGLLALPFTKLLRVDGIAASRHSSVGQIFVAPRAEAGLRLLDTEARSIFINYLYGRVDSLDEPGPNVCGLTHPEIPARVIFATYPKEHVVLILSVTIEEK